MSPSSTTEVDLTCTLHPRELLPQRSLTMQSLPWPNTGLATRKPSSSCAEKMRRAICGGQGFQSTHAAITKIPSTACLTNIYFSHFWKLGSLKSWCQHFQGLVRPCFLSAGCHLTVTSQARKEEGTLWMGLTPFVKAWPSRPNKLLKTPPPNIITLEYKLVKEGYKYPGYGRESPINIQLWNSGRWPVSADVDLGGTTVDCDKLNHGIWESEDPGRAFNQVFLNLFSHGIFLNTKTYTEI